MDALDSLYLRLAVPLVSACAAALLVVSYIVLVAKTKLAWPL